MNPDAPNAYYPDPKYLQELIRRSGLSQKAVARRIGVTDRMIRYYLSGDRRFPYSVQYCMEAIAAKR